MVGESCCEGDGGNEKKFRWEIMIVEKLVISKDFRSESVRSEILAVRS